MEKRNIHKRSSSNKKPYWLFLPICCLALVLIISLGVIQFQHTLFSIPSVRSAKIKYEASNAIQDTYLPADGAWHLTLVNQWNPLPKNYALELVEIEGGELVDKRIYKPLMEMLNDAQAEGLSPIVVSGYRTNENQQNIMDQKISTYRQQGYSKIEAKELAQQWVALPGTSEHQLGLAVDINGGTYDIYLWLQENSYKYGFILRYPGDKTEITGVSEEVWHYRYVGIEAACEIYEQDICLEEYIESLNG